MGVGAFSPLPMYGASCHNRVASAGGHLRSHSRSPGTPFGRVAQDRAGNKNGQNCFFQETGGILFREYSFGEDNSLSLTELWGKLCEFCEKLGEFALSHK